MTCNSGEFHVHSCDGLTPAFSFLATSRAGMSIDRSQRRGNSILAPARVFCETWSKTFSSQCCLIARTRFLEHWSMGTWLVVHPWSLEVKRSLGLLAGSTETLDSNVFVAFILFTILFNIL